VPGAKVVAGLRSHPAAPVLSQLSSGVCIDDRGDAMIGGKWERAEAKVAAYKFERNRPHHRFVVDVQPPGGAPAFRASFAAFYVTGAVPAVGDVVPVLCETKRRKVEIDPEGPVWQPVGDASARAQAEADRLNFDVVRKAAPDSAAPVESRSSERQVPPGDDQSPRSDIANDLAKLADLRDRGALTDAEFDAQKRKLLDA
jgi:hypothetical protein